MQGINLVSVIHQIERIKKHQKLPNLPLRNKAGLDTPLGALTYDRKVMISSPNMEGGEGLILLLGYYLPPS